MFEESSREEERTFSPVDIPRIILRRLWAILLVAVVVTGSAVGFSLPQAPIYEASILILVGQESPEGGDGSPSKDIADPEQIIQTVSRAIDTLPVAQGVVERLGLPEGYSQEVLNNTSSEPEPNTMFISVSYRDLSPERAQLIANATGEVISDQAPKLNISTSTITAKVWQEAMLPQDPVSPNPLRAAAIGAVFGILLGVGLAFLFEYLDGAGPREKGRKGSSRIRHSGSSPYSNADE